MRIRRDLVPCRPALYSRGNDAEVPPVSTVSLPIRNPGDNAMRSRSAFESNAVWIAMAIGLAGMSPGARAQAPDELRLQPNAIAVGPGAGDNEHNQVKFGARESRLFAKTSTPTVWGDLVTYVEGDFYGA